jgi:hypothetical protein
MSHQMHYLVNGHQQDLHREAREARLAKEARKASGTSQGAHSMSVGRLLARLLSPVAAKSGTSGVVPSTTKHVAHGVR